MRQENLAARAGRWSAQHRKQAVLGWIAFVILASVVGGMVGTNTLKRADTGTGESQRADRMIDHAFPREASETILVQARNATSGTARDPRFRAAIADVVARVRRVSHVTDVRSPYAPANAAQISTDGRSSLVELKLRGDDDQAKKRVGAVLDQTAAAQKDHPGLRIEQFGDASASKALSKSFSDDFHRAEITSLPITLIILAIAFGALVAAGLPVLLGLTAVVATLGLVSLVSQIAPMDESITSVILLIGLAVGVDYSLFYLRREREERAAGRSEDAALQAAAATSGRAVLVSGLTVMIAMAGMYLAGSSVFSSFATGTILVVAVAMLGSVSVLPAILSKLGDRVETGRIPWLGRRRRVGESRLWGAVLDRVLERPVVSVAASVALLVALAVPALGMHTSVPGIDGLPHNLAVIKTYDRIQAAFPGNQIPAEVVVRGDNVTSPRFRAAIADFGARARHTRGIVGAPSTTISPDRTVADIRVPIAGDGSDATSDAALARIRGQLVPRTLESVPGATVATTGQTAGTKDFNDLMKSHIAWVFAFVLGMAFLLLLVTFRSLVIPLKAIALNLLSVAAAYGLLTLVFQHGWGASLIGLHETRPITSWLPLFLFVVLFGLSMDYHVFILSRIREAFDGGASTEQAVSRGIRSTAGVVTSAAIVMVAVFAIFATLSAVEFKQMGVGLAAAVLIDATLIRGVLLPAAMTLLGDWNWYLPRALDWLPRGRHEAPSLAPRPKPETERVAA